MTIQELLHWLTSHRELQVSEQNYLQALTASRKATTGMYWLVKRDFNVLSSLLRSEQRIADGHPTQIQQVREEKLEDWYIEILRNINPGHTRPERHVWPERHVKLAFKHTNVNFILPSYPSDSACYISTHKWNTICAWYLCMTGSCTSLNRNIWKNAKAQGWPLKKAYTQSSQVDADDSLQEQDSREMKGQGW